MTATYRPQGPRCATGDHDEGVAHEGNIVWFNGVIIPAGTRFCSFCKTILSDLGTCHDLLSGGRPYTWRNGRWVLADRHVSTGYAACSCGVLFGPLETDCTRQGWHRSHEDHLHATLRRR